jgi:hypothetical protein
MTATPEFKAQQQTAPLLVDSTAIPDQRQVVFVRNVVASAGMRMPFEADVVSQDDPAGAGVFSAVLFDYGVSFAGFPSREQFAGNQVPPATVDQMRLLQAYWTIEGFEVNGCHTVTLVASHHLEPQSQCPCFANDYSMLTWYVLICDPGVAGSCDTLPTSGSAACPLQNVPAEAGANCADFVSAPDGGAAAYCAQFGDGGSP